MNWKHICLCFDYCAMNKRNIDNKLPIYKLYEKKGSPHSPIFTVTLSCLEINGIIGKGSSKRLAEKKQLKIF